jgi:hypothetical protein
MHVRVSPCFEGAMEGGAVELPLLSPRWSNRRMELFRCAAIGTNGVSGRSLSITGNQVHLMYAPIVRCPFGLCFDLSG